MILFFEKLAEHIQNILLSLPETAPCFEALRIYLILPFCHIFENDDMFETIATPYAQAVTRLKEKADGRVLDYWILHLGRHFIERILEVNLFEIDPSAIVILDFTRILGIQKSGDQNNPSTSSNKCSRGSTVSSNIKINFRSTQKS